MSTPLDLGASPRSTSIPCVPGITFTDVPVENLLRTQYRVPNDPRRLSEASVSSHAAYHDALAGGCGSEWLMRLRRQLYDQSERYRRLAGREVEQHPFHASVGPALQDAGRRPFAADRDDRPDGPPSLRHAAPLDHR